MKTEKLDNRPKMVVCKTVTRSARSQTKADAKRAYLIEQATRCLAEKGYARVSLRDIARESGVSLGILHYYFASKEDLLLAVISGYKERFLRELEQELLSAPLEGWMDRLLAVLRRALVEDQAVHRLWYDFQVQAMYLPAFRDGVREIRARLFELIGEMLDRLRREAGFSPLTEADEAVPLLYSLIDGLFFQALLHEADDPEQTVNRLEQALPRMLALLLSPSSQTER